jgi:hypothetical protein
MDENPFSRFCQKKRRASDVARWVVRRRRSSSWQKKKNLIVGAGGRNVTGIQNVNPIDGCHCHHRSAARGWTMLCLSVPLSRWQGDTRYPRSTLIAKGKQKQSAVELGRELATRSHGRGCRCEEHDAGRRPVRVGVPTSEARGVCDILRCGGTGTVHSLAAIVVADHPFKVQGKTSHRLANSTLGASRRVLHTPSHHPSTWDEETVAPALGRGVKCAVTP